MEDIKLGDRVIIPSKNSKGEVAFIGLTDFSSGVFFGIILDEAKGKHNGSVNGHRYFKCPKNHGVFVRACQIQKEYADDNGASKRNIYPNYLRSKTKIDNYKTASRNSDTCAFNTNKNLDQQNQIRCEDLKAHGKISQLEMIKNENKQLKNKVKTTEESLQEYICKYNKAMEEIKNVQEDLSYKNKQLKIHKWHIKFLKLRQCNKFQENDPVHPSNKKLNQNKNDDDINLFNTELNLSDDELDLESVKTFASLQRIIELEDENRRLVQGITKLNEFLNSKLLSQYANLDSSNMNVKGYLMDEVVEAKAIPDYSNSFCGLKSDNFIDGFSTAQQVNCTEMLREMTTFNELVNKKGKTVNHSVAQNFEADGQGDFSSTENQHTSESDAYNFASEFPKQFPSQLISHSESTDWAKTNTHGNYKSRSSFNYDAAVSGDNFQTTKNSFQHYYKSENKEKEKGHLQNNIGDTTHSKLTMSNLVHQTKQTTTAVKSSSNKVQCYSNMSLIQQPELEEKHYDNSSNLIHKKSEYDPKSQLIFPNEMTAAAKSSGDYELILPDGNKSRKNMFVSSNMNVRKDLRNDI